MAIAILSCGKNKTTAPPPTTQDGLISTTLISGKLLRVDISGNYCYCAADGAFKILSIENPQLPTLVGEIPTGGDAEFIEIIDNYAYILCRFGLTVIDVTDPESPELITEFTEVAGAVDMVRSGNIAVISNLTDELKILDIGNPRNPTIIGSIDSVGYSLWNMHLEGHILYTSGYNNATILSIANPGNPTIVGYIGSSGPGIIRGYNGYLYLGYGDAGIKIYSILNPVSPSYVGDISGNYTMITFHENYAYLKRRYAPANRYIDIADISNPSNPVMAGSFATDYEPVYELHAEDDMLFIIDDSSIRENMLHIADLASPTDPVELGTFTSFGGYLSDVFVFDNYAFVIQTPYLNIVDVHDVYHPAPMGSFFGVGGRSGAWNTVEYYQNHVFLVGPSTQGMSIIDVSDPANPELAGTYESLHQAEFNDIDLEGNILFVASANQGLLVLDVSNPVQPQLINQITGPVCDSIIVGVYVEGNYCYFVNFCPRLKIYDISNPYDMTLVGECSTPHASGNLFVYDNVAFLPVAYTATDLVDVSDPHNPTFIIDHPGPPTNYFDRRITAAGNSLFIPTLDWGVNIYDISDPLNSYLDRKIDTPNIASGVSAADGIIYVADGSSLCLYRYPY